MPRRLKEIATKSQEVKTPQQYTGRAQALTEITKATGYTHEQIMQALESSKAYGTYSLKSAAAEPETTETTIRWKNISGLKIQDMSG